MSKSRINGIKDNRSVNQKQNGYNDIVVLLCLSSVKQGILYISLIILFPKIKNILILGNRCAIMLLGTVI